MTKMNPPASASSPLLVNRWRLVLGKYAAGALGGCSDAGEGEQADYAEIDELLHFLYDREYSAERGVREGGAEDSRLSVPVWLRRVQRLFPRETAEKLEAHALDRYGLTDLLRDASVLASLEPNMTLLKQILALKGLMKGAALNMARRIVRQVTEELKRKMQYEVRAAITGRRDRHESTRIRCAKNFDIKKTIRKNLKNYNRERECLLVERVFFYRNLTRFNPYHIIICVDESGSMVENVIHSAVMAGSFASLPVLAVKLVVFDTNVVDLSEYVQDPTEALMSVQLGGGTDIGRALAYCETLISTPHRTIVVLVSDLCDGQGYRPMYAGARRIVETGARLIALTSLDQNCVGMYDRTAAKHLAALGASVAALTPGRLADWIGEVMAGGGKL
ncbi:MAG: VWA domain-containing protein [Gracilibacteraceae bacterium]|jgi:Mg-chelatase subunit ChlD|nr:VWA domain-containing protein [Gracilibacteraceae bacterium]